VALDQLARLLIVCFPDDPNLVVEHAENLVAVRILLLEQAHKLVYSHFHFQKLFVGHQGLVGILFNDVLEK
jgi:hypothetical protein